MLFLKILLVLVVLSVGGLAFLALTDVSVKHSQITKTIPNDRFLSTH